MRLRELRRGARLTGRDLADACGWVPSKVSKIESGRQTPSEADIETWTAVCRRPEVAAELNVALSSLESMYVEVRRKARFGMAKGQAVAGERDQKATRVRAFAPATVPGLLQTPDYARHRLAHWARVQHRPDEVDEAVAARMARQHVLYTTAGRFHFVLTEAALRYRLCSPEALDGQLDRLASAATLATIHLGIIPFTAQYEGPGPMHSFVIYDEAAVVVETVSAEIRVEQAAELSAYLAAFTEYADLAVYGSHARELIANARSNHS